MLTKNNLNNQVIYKLAPLWKVFFSRLIDLIIVSIFPFLVSWVIYANFNYLFQWQKTLIVHLNALVNLFFYFILIPYFTQGTTLGKFITRIRIICQSKKKITFSILWYRELFLTFLPWLLIIISNFIIFYFFNFSFFAIDNYNIFLISNKTSNMSVWVRFIVRIVSFINLFWYLTLMLIYKIDKKNQIFFDLQLGVYVINYQPIMRNKPENSKKNDTITREEQHIHLAKKQPGNIDDNSLEEIENL